MILLRDDGRGQVDMLHVRGCCGEGCGCCRDRGNGSPGDGSHDVAAAALGIDGIRGTRSRCWERC